MDRYVSEMSEQRLDAALSNENLPNLRASFLREIVAETYPVKAPLILDGTVSQKLDDKDRNAELLLYVEW